jgi:hypothetical protein
MEVPENIAQPAFDDVVPKSAWGSAVKLLIRSRVLRSPFVDNFRLADHSTQAW